MKMFVCAACHRAVFFENVRCGACGHTLAYLPEHAVLSPLVPTDSPSMFTALAPEAAGARYRLCENSRAHGVCNWAVPEQSASTLCVACDLNEVIPDLSCEGALSAWRSLEGAKRRLVYSLFELGLSIGDGLRFAFKADQGSEKVVTGHHDGLITINIAEADDRFREKMRVQMGETYRTLLGHFRHEVGHFYWDRLVARSEWLEPFRDRFGDERADYAKAAGRHYKEGPPKEWHTSFVSAYASMHPWEDWAETFAHYLHMVDTLDTARDLGLVLRPPRRRESSVLPPLSARRVRFANFDDLSSAWLSLTIALNNLNRSMGLHDLYPFALSKVAIEKLGLVHQLIEQHHERATATPASASVPAR